MKQKWKNPFKILICCSYLNIRCSPLNFVWKFWHHIPIYPWHFVIHFEYSMQMLIFFLFVDLSLKLCHDIELLIESWTVYSSSSPWNFVFQFEIFHEIEFSRFSPQHTFCTDLSILPNNTLLNINTPTKNHFFPGCIFFAHRDSWIN